MELVTGMSGAGKTLALQTLEDIGYYCVDNLPPQLLLYLLNSELESGIVRDKMAVTIDIRSASFFVNMEEMKKALEEKGITVRILFLNASDEQLRRRYKETRRLHPLILQGSAIELSEALAAERKSLTPLRQHADIVLDTSDYPSYRLRRKLIEFVAFGYKYGILADADIVFDLRCLPNPFYEETLRNLTGNDQAVRDFVLAGEEGKTLYEKTKDYLEYIIPLYVKQGKPRLVVGFGCTGGQHRSLAFAGMLKEYFSEKYSSVRLICRDTEENRYEIVRRLAEDKQTPPTE